MEGEFEQGMQPVALGGGEESAGFVGGEGFDASGPWGAGADVAGDVARHLLFADGVLQGGLEHGVDVGERQRGEQLVAALAGGAAAGLVAPGVDAARAALAGGAELVEPGADVLGGELGQLLLAEAGDEVPIDAGGVAGVGVLAESVDGDAAEPVGEVVADGAVGGGDRETAVAVGDFLGGSSPCAAVDPDAWAAAVGGEDLAGGFPAAVLALVEDAFAVGAGLLPLGGGHQAASSRWRWT
ncbi:hypothetical protein GCM10018772_02710 [Streptomyces fumanus]|uniref:Uncharacterized protein n=1 Tax=Streptomyces fumanus TaxID=67302 RepID=A0A919A2L5_9ACTN|nr:hypothetical protein GCM10018772_02710 [Streptomyces fumanus]